MSHKRRHNRKDEVAHLISKVRDLRHKNEMPVVLVYGPEGIGKMSVALEYLSSEEERYARESSCQLDVLTIAAAIT